MAKRVAEWPPRTARRRRRRTAAYRSSPPSSRRTRCLPTSSSSPSAHDHHGLNDDALHARMQGLEICCETDKEHMTQEEDDTRPRPCWSCFLPELLWLIRRRLSLADVPRFWAVCKHWNSCAFPVYPADATPVLISGTVTDTGLVRCYSPYFNKMFVLSARLRGSRKHDDLRSCKWMGYAQDT